MASHVISKPAFLGRIAVVAAAALLLGGCAGAAPEPAASPDTTQSATTSVSASPTATATAIPAYKPASAKGPAQNVPLPVLPAVAKTETKEGLEAFTRYWYKLLDYGYQTGDTVPLAGVSAPGCRFCTGLREGIQEAWQEDRWIVGGTVETPAVTATLDPGTEAYAAVQVVQEVIEIRNADGTLHQKPTPATNTGSRTGAVFGSKGWVVSDIGFIR